MNITTLMRCAICVLGIAVLAGCGNNSARDAEDAQRHVKTAGMYAAQGQYRAAMIEARNAIQRQSEHPDGYLALARIYNEIGAHLPAQELLKEPVKKMPSMATELANAYFGGAKYSSAIATVQTYPADNNEDKKRQHWLIAMSSIYLGDQSAYEAALTQLKNSGETRDARYVEANFYVSKGDLEKALTLLQENIRENSEDDDSLMLSSTIHVVLGQLESAEKQLTSILSRLTNSDVMTRQRSQVISVLSDVLVQQGRTSEAYTYQKLLADTNPEANLAQQRFNDAMAHYQEGKFSEAEAILRALREEFPNDKNTATLLGLVEYQQGDTDKATALFDQFVDPETANTSILQAATLAKFRENKADEALDMLREAAKNQPNNANIYATLGLALLDNDRKSQEGAHALEKSLAINPSQQRLRIALANRHLAVNQPEHAIAQLQTAHNHTPDDIYIQQSYYKTLAQLNEYELLKTAIETFTAKNPTDYRGDFFQGWYELQLKDNKSALQSFQRSLAKAGAGDKHLPYSGIAQAHLTSGDATKSLAAWQKAIDANPNFAAAYGPWSTLVKQLSKMDEALDFLTALQQTYNGWEPSMVKAQLYADSNHLDKAIASATEALARSNQHPRMKTALANLQRAYGNQFKTKGDYSQAREYLLEASGTLTKDVNLLADIIDNEIKAGAFEEAKKVLAAFEFTTDQTSQRLYLHGLITWASGDKQQALTTLESSWAQGALDPTGEAMFELYRQTGEPQKATHFLKEWVAALPQSHRANLLMALSAQGEGREADAIRYYENALRASPNVPAALNNLAWLYYQAKDARAAAVAKRAYELAPTSAAIADTYGWILVETGDVAAGEEVLKKALQLEPTNNEIRDHYEQARLRR